MGFDGPEAFWHDTRQETATIDNQSHRKDTQPEEDFIPTSE
jgi:hypothetical protein